MPDPALRVTATDYHTAGEPFRIVTSPIPDIAGDSVAARRETLRADVAREDCHDAERVRRLLVREPRGHTDMYGCFVVPPDDDEADFGVLFWHQDGYSTACGHGTIALGTWAVESGRVRAEPDGTTEVVIDVPSGRVTATVTCVAGRARSVAFRNVGSYVIARDVPVAVPHGEVRCDVSYGGAIYASLPASALGLRVAPECYRALIAGGRAVKQGVEATEWATRVADPRMAGVYGTIFYDDLPSTPDGLRQRNVAIFADGQVDRSPCGSGTCARVALLADDGLLGEGQVFTHESVVGTTFTARIVGRDGPEEAAPVRVEVTGSAHVTGEHVFRLDDADPLPSGFVLR